VSRACWTRMPYEDRREDVRNKSCVSGSGNLDNDKTRGQRGSTAADQSGKRVAR